MTKTQANTVIIGGGIIGLSIAATLRRSGVEVLLLDADEICRGASWGNAGHLATEQVYPVADPSMLRKIPSMLMDPLGPLRLDWRYLLQLSPWAWKTLVNILPKNFQHNHEALLMLNKLSLPTWKEFSQEWKLDQWVHIRGSLLVCEKEKTALHLRKYGEKLNNLGVENQWLSKAQLQDYAPELNAEQEGGLFYPETGHISDLQAMSNALLEGFKSMGGLIQEYTKVLKTQLQSDGLYALSTTKGTVLTQKVILAAGAFSKELAQELTGVKVPLDTERGYHLMLPEEKGVFDLPISSADRRFIMTPMNTGLRLAGTVEYAGLEAPANMDRAQNLLPLAQGMLKRSLDSSNASQWMGFRPTTADSLPVIDRIGNVFLAFGHQHLGLTHAACTAKAIEALFFEKPWPFDLQKFFVRRFV